MDRGLVRLVERQDPALAALLADDRRTARHSTAAGDRYLVVPASSEAASRHDLRDLGSCAISGTAWHRATSRAHRGAGAHAGSQLLGSSIHGNDVTLREQHEACPREGLPVTAKGVGIVISGAGHEHTDLRCRPEHTDVRGRPRAHRPQRPATSTPTSGAGHEHIDFRGRPRAHGDRQGPGPAAGSPRGRWQPRRWRAWSAHRWRGLRHGWGTVELLRVAHERELRPRGGRSPRRPLYREVGAGFLVGAVGPQAQGLSLGFRRAGDTLTKAERSSLRASLADRFTAILRAFDPRRWTGDQAPRVW